MPPKKRKAAAANEADTEEAVLDKDQEIALLKAQIKELQASSQRSEAYQATVYASKDAGVHHLMEIPSHGMNPRHVKELLEGVQELDVSPRLNTSSYVNVVQEPEERDVAMMGAAVNLADASVYPASVQVHDKVVDMCATLWNAPPPPINPATGRPGHYSGSGTVGSTEACLLAGLAHKFRWRKWYGQKYCGGLDMADEAVVAIRPNLVMSSVFQAAWEKLFKYFDIEPRFVKPSIHTFQVDPKEMMKLCDEKTIAVVGILGNHYNGSYDPIWDIDTEITKLNKAKGYQIGIHVDAASGGFVAPFQDEVPAWDFRLRNVLSISASGHKFGESICGTGWVVFRQRKDLTEHISISVSYLGGTCDSITLNFSRPASGCYVQMYKFLRLGMAGYRTKVDNQMRVAAYLRQKFREMKRPDGEPRFEILDSGDTGCLPVVATRLNNIDGALSYDDIDLQHALAESRWYVSGYGLTFENPANGGAKESLFHDAPITAVMGRVVVKSNISQRLAMDLIHQVEKVLPTMDQHGYTSVKSMQHKDANSHEQHQAC